MGRGSGSPYAVIRGVAAEVEAPLWKHIPARVGSYFRRQLFANAPIAASRVAA